MKTNMSKEECLEVLEREHELAVKLEKLKHSNRMEIHRIERADRIKQQEREFANRSELIRQDLDATIQKQEHKNRMIFKGHR